MASSSCPLETKASKKVKSGKSPPLYFHGHRGKVQKKTSEKESIEEFLARGGKLQRGVSMNCFYLTYERLYEIVDDGELA